MPMQKRVRADAIDRMRTVEPFDLGAVGNLQPAAYRNRTLAYSQPTVSSEATPS